MFERFTDKGIKAIMLAQEEARRLGHNFVGTEQILLGLIGEATGIASKVLSSRGVKLKEARIEVEKIIGRGFGNVEVNIPFTPRTKRLLELSLAESERFNHDYVCTEHLLLGLIREGEGVAIKVLNNLGIDLAELQNQVLIQLNQTPVSEPNQTVKDSQSIPEEQPNQINDNNEAKEQLYSKVIDIASVSEVGSILEENQQHLDSAFVQLLEQHLLEARKHSDFQKTLRLLYLLAFVQTDYVKADRTDIERGIAHAEEALLLAQELRDRATEGATYRLLGCAYYDLIEHQTAIEYHKKSLKIARELNDPKWESLAYHNLGLAYNSLSQYQDAIDYFRLALQIARKVNFCKGKRLAYYNLGFTYKYLGDQQTAIHFYQKSLAIAQEVNDRKTETIIYFVLGDIYYKLKEFQAAIEYYHKELQIAQELNDRKQEGFAYNGLGRAYSSLGESQTAIYYHQKELQIFQELEERSSETIAYYNLRKNYHSLGLYHHYSVGQYQTAIDYYQKELQISQKFNDREREGRAYEKCGSAYNSLGQYEKAIESYQKALDVAQKLKNSLFEFRTDLNLAMNHIHLNQFKLAIHYYQQGLPFAKEINDRTPEKFLFYKCFALAYRLLGEYQNAIHYYRQALDIARKLNNQEKQQSIYENLGNAYKYLGEYQTAIDHYRQALDIAIELNNREQEGDIYRKLGNTYTYLNQYQVAINYYQLSLDIARSLNDRKAQGSVYHDLGNVSLYLGEYQTAIKYFQLSLEVAQELHDQEKEGVAYDGLSVVYLMLGEYQICIDYQKKFLKITQELHDQKEEARAYFRLGNIYIALGEYQNAIICFQKELQLAQELHDQEEEATACYGLGSAYFALGENQTSLRYNQLVLQLAEESGQHEQLWLKLMAYLGLGNGYWALGEDQTSLYYYQRVWQLTEELGQHHLKSVAYMGFGNAYNFLGEYQTALEYYQKALEIAQELGQRVIEASAYTALGNLYKYLGEHQTAIQMYQTALEMTYVPAFPSSKAVLLFPELALEAGRGLGNLTFTQGDWKSTIEAYEISVFATEHLRAVSLTDQRRQKVIEESFDVYANLIHAYVQVGEFEKAIETADRSRAKHLVDLMHSSDLYKDGNISEEVRQLLAEYEAIQQELDQRRQQDSPPDLGTMGKITQPSAEVLAQQDQRNREKIVELEQRKQYLYEQIRLADPILAGQIQVEPLSFQQMRQLLTSSTTALVNIYTVYTDTYIFILTQKGDPQVFTCTGQGGTNLQAWLEREWLLPYLNIKQSQSLQEAQQKRQAWIDEMPDFLQELAEKLQLSTLINEEVFQNIDELIIIPHLLLHFIPFAALPVNKDQTQYLGEQFTLRIIPSARILDYCHQRSATPHSQTLNYHPLPLLSQPHLPSTMGTVEDTTSDLPFACFLGDELAKLLNISSDRRLRQQQATPDDYRDLLDQVQGIHHYHHASYQLENPLESALALADGNRLTLGQLLTPSWRMPGMPNIFLAACETQVGEINITDDIISLGAGFLIAGARNVISTLWSVDQLGTAVFCLLFYENVQQGMNRALALQTAQKQMREMSGREFNQRYGKRIKRYLKEQESALTDQHDQCEQQWQEASGDLKEKLEQEKMQLSQRIGQFRDNYGFVREREREEAPFSHPYYWSAFISQGLA